MADSEIRDEVVERATGRRWAGWLAVLDAWGAAGKEHREIARHLAESYGLSGWWSQMVTVHYERLRGLREVGQTASGKYQVGVQRTLDGEPEMLWERLVGPDGPALWLGAGAPRRLTEGLQVHLDDGTTGTVRVLREGSHVRLAWQPPGWAAPSTLQLRVSGASRSGRTTVAFHHEGLPDPEAREALREHWRGVLDRLAGLAAEG